ncbi:peptide/nickel transport system ATP-binding protein [Homoserinimonas aerilata]|uniref:Peptide/nickel transport system ATP-binding protein n=1 Tax=Homoserinimonas aerilata TaxID=1162970 RepID=A0A542YI50_9MICO|nr:ABC transporter ATP-binding protein [Homoserinimonas aerilata]TQL47763.1 peptide/nickel transport system ATP-binding protein [Homoserinimonas aerilata]
MTTPQRPLLSVRGLRVGFGRGRHHGDVVRDISFDIAPGECLALVGESGSGKSVTARALIGLAGDGSAVKADKLEFEGTQLLGRKAGAWRSVRGSRIGLVLQDALVSLDPLRPIGREIGDVLRLHTELGTEERHARVIELLESVGMPDPEVRARQRSGELSGGLRQRALIASAIAAGPSLIIADEPTTALDVTVQAQVLDLLGRLKASGTALLLISHDLAVVSSIADRVAVMRAGQIAEQGPTEQVLRRPEHPYTKQLLRSVPSDVPRGQRLSVEPPRGSVLEALKGRDAEETPGAPDAPALEARGLVKEFRRPGADPLRAVDDVSFVLPAGTTLGLVGESGSGKTTVARLALGLEHADGGEVLLEGEAWSALPERERRARRHRIGAIYQDALSSFDPRLTVGEILRDALGVPRRGGAASARIAELLDAVGLASVTAERRPLHLSGGQRQRVAIARALAPSPRVIICDEPVSALDVSVQAQVLDLLSEVQSSLGVAYLFISHDLGVVQHMSDSIAVMRAGRIVETGTAEQLFTAARHEYTQQLIAAAPRL